MRTRSTAPLATAVLIAVLIAPLGASVTRRNAIAADLAACAAMEPSDILDHSGSAYITRAYLLVTQHGDSVQLSAADRRARNRAPIARFAPNGQMVACTYGPWLDEAAQVFVYHLESARIATSRATARRIDELSWVTYRDSLYVMAHTAQCTESPQDPEGLWLVNPQSGRVVWSTGARAVPFEVREGRLLIDPRRLARVDLGRGGIGASLRPALARRALERTLPQVTRAIEQRDMRALARLIHPEKGLRVSHHAYVRRERDLFFLPEELQSLQHDESLLCIGEEDGSGHPVRLRFTQILTPGRPIARVTRVSFNKTAKRSNTTNNAAEAYPGAIVVEYYWAGEGQMADFTWAARRLVFQRLGARWVLVGLITDGWTI